MTGFVVIRAVKHGYSALSESDYLLKCKCSEDQMLTLGILDKLNVSSSSSSSRKEEFVALIPNMVKKCNLAAFHGGDCSDGGLLVVTP